MISDDKMLELLQSFEGCNEDLEAIYIEVYSLRLELKALNQKAQEMRKRFQALNRQLPEVESKSKPLTVPSIHKSKYPFFSDWAN